MRNPFLLLTLIIFCSCSSSRFSRVEIDLSAIPEGNGILSELVLQRIEERVPSPDSTLPVLKLIYETDPTLADECAVVTIKGDKAVVRASGKRGFVFGSGKFLRSLRYEEKGLEAPRGKYTFSPALYAKPFSRRTSIM
mgnify:CR=1 FL=1